MQPQSGLAIHSRATITENATLQYRLIMLCELSISFNTVKPLFSSVLYYITAAQSPSFIILQQ